jgi:NAD(P)-dependent dehydrogenase (short-subunit alcohol dehydrogenase family)
MKKIIIFGASGTIGRHVTRELEREKHTVVKVGRKSGDFTANLEEPATLDALYAKVGKFDAVVSTAGEVAFAPLANLTGADWARSFRSKLMGQIELVTRAVPFVSDGGSFTLISGITGDAPILGGVAATTVNRALEGFVRAAACELPRGIRINIISPGLLEDSAAKYEGYFPGFVPVSGALVAQTYKRSIFGIETGQIYRV